MGKFQQVTRDQLRPHTSGARDGRALGGPCLSKDNDGTKSEYHWHKKYLAYSSESHWNYIHAQQTTPSSSSCNPDSNVVNKHVCLSLNYCWHSKWQQPLQAFQMSVLMAQSSFQLWLVSVFWFVYVFWLLSLYCFTDKFYGEMLWCWLDKIAARG